MVEVRWSNRALSDLEAIGEFFERSSPEYARVLVSRLFAAVEELADFPRLGRMVPEIGLEDVRELIRDGYRIIYLAFSERVEILTIVHSRQDLASQLRGG